MRIPCLAIFIFIISINAVKTFNFLVFSPSFGHSHSTFMGKIADTLKEAGHKVTFLTFVVSSHFRNVSYTKLVDDVIFIETTTKIDEKIRNMETGDFSRFWSENGGMLDTIPTYVQFIEMFEDAYDNLRNNLHVLDDLKKTRPKFDAIIFESFVFMGTVVQDYLEIPVYLPVTSITHDNKLAELIGEPVSPSYLSGYFTNYGNSMNFWERSTNTISYVLGKFILLFPKWKSLRDPSKYLDIEINYPHAPFFFVNSNPYIDFSRPMIPKTISIGGITVDVEHLKSNTVDKKWSNILDQRPKTILISFGSMFHSIHMPESYKKNLIEVMKSMPNVTFIWKYEDPQEATFSRGVENVILSKWVPQTALLADSRLSAFLTHGGLGSVNELSYLGKPAILCPLFADQLRNAKMLAQHNGSLEISKFSLANFQLMKSAFESVLYDGSYLKNAENLSRRLAKQPIKPKELLVRHAEFAAEFGEQVKLNCHLKNMSFIEYYLIDVILFFAGFTAIVIGLLYWTVLLILRVRKIKKD